MRHRLTRLLAPQSIAIVGASARAGSIAAATQRQLQASAYRGRILPVNPRYDEVFGEPCVGRLLDLPVTPDLVVYAISGLALEQSFDEAIEIGVGGVVIYAANHVENDVEPPLTERLRAKAAAAGIPVCGGNSMGFYNYDDNVFVSFDTPPPGRPPGHIGLIAHSGSGMTYLANNDLRFCYNYVIASAQEINASVGDYMDYLLEQATTRVIAVLLEAVRDAPGLIAALHRARAKSIPVVIMRLGRSERGARMAMSHSGAMVGDYAALAALCRRHGAILCRDLDEMIVTAMLFATGRRVERGKLSAMLDSGGMREQMIDLAEDHGIPFARIADTTTATLRTHLEAGLDAVNPMDGMGALGRNSAQTFLECGKALLDDAETGLLGFEFEFRDGFSHYPELLDVARELAAWNDKPVVLINSSSYSSLARTAAELTWQGIPVISGIDVALRALRHFMTYRRGSMRAEVTPGLELDRDLLRDWRMRLAEAGCVGESTALQLAADFGLPAVAFRVAENPEQLQAAARLLGYPLVLKTAMPGIAHKSDQDGVRLGIENSAELDDAYADLQRRLGERVIVMPQVVQGVEVVLGMKNDAQFGPLVVVGCGGVLVELLAERALRLAPVDAAEADAMLDETRLGLMLGELRGRPALDRAALVDTIVRFSVLVSELGDVLDEVDLNPVIVNASGCHLVDALLVARN